MVAEWTNIDHPIVKMSTTTGAVNNMTSVAYLSNSSTVTPGLLEKQPHLTAFMLILYGIIFVVGIFGNSLVLYVVISNKKMQSITNNFIAGLSISDLLLCLFAIPFTPINALMKSWIFGEALCKLVPVILLMSVFVSTLSSVVIALDRYMAVVHPYAQRMTPTMQVVVFIAIWMLSAMAAVPIGVFTVLEEKKDKDILNCLERWPNTVSVQMYTWVIFTLQLVIPTIIITVCYSAIAIQLRRTATHKLGNRTRDLVKEQRDARRNCRINKMLIAMIVIFIICWLPLDLIHVTTWLAPSDNFLTVFLFFHILAMSSVMYNPFLYGWMNENFNRHFRQLWKSATSRCCIKWQRRDRESKLDNGNTVGDESRCSVTGQVSSAIQATNETSLSLVEAGTTLESVHTSKDEESQSFLPSGANEGL